MNKYLLYYISGKAMSQAWVDIFPVILTTFRDGYVIGNQDGATISITKMFYPKVDFSHVFIEKITYIIFHYYIVFVWFW